LCHEWHLTSAASRLARYSTSAEPKADLVIDLILSSGVQAQSVMHAFRGSMRRIVAASSIDVYRACGVLPRQRRSLLGSSAAA
jgi:hypothetical protein